MAAKKAPRRSRLFHVQDADGKHVGSSFAPTSEEAVDRVAKHVKRAAKGLRAVAAVST